MKKIFILFFALITSAVSMFASVEIDGIAYNLNTTNLTAEVTSKTEKYSGDVIIPESVTYDGVEYTVTSIKSNAFYNCSSLTSINIPNSVTNIGSSAFMYCEILSSINIPNSVKSIGNYAFMYCNRLTYILIPYSVTSIGDNALNGSPFVSIDVEESNPNYCSIDGVLFSKDKTTLIQYSEGNSRTEYIIPSSVTSIKPRAFQYSYNLNSVIIPHSVTSIESATFSSCIGLTSIEIPNSITSIGSSAFSSCRSLTSIEIPNSVTSIGSSAFSSCSGLTSIKIPNSVASIGEAAFSNCGSIISFSVEDSNINYCSIDGVLFDKTITKIIQYPAKKTGAKYIIPNSVTSIGSSAFSSCLSLTSIEIPNSVTSIGVCAFQDCYNLSFVTIPNSVTRIEKATFGSCYNLGYITIPNSIKSIGNEAFQDIKWMTCEAVEPPSIYSNSFNRGTSNSAIVIYVPAESVDAYKAANVWKDFTNIQAIPEESPWIIASGTCGAEGDNLSWELNSVNTLTISGSGMMKDYQQKDSVPWAFYRKVIKIVSLHNEITHIGNYAFSSCTSLTSMEIPNSVTSIGKDAFASCSALISVSIPNSVTSIGESAFCFCSSLTSIEIPNSITDIQWTTFNGCNSLTSVTIPNSVTSLEYGCFQNCSSLVSIEIPNSVTYISQRVFCGCTSLTTVTIPCSVISLSSDAFENCTALTSINVEEAHTTYCSVDGVLFRKDKTTLCVYPAGKKGTKYNILDGVKNIASEAFYNCSQLTSVTIPNSVTIIGQNAFFYCTGLKSITCEAINPPSNYNNTAFTGVDKSIPVYVPAESVEAYRNADQWKDFTNIQAIAGFDPEHPANPGSYQLTLVVEDTNKGYTTGSGLYEQGATAHIEAIARDGYQFVCWSDNDSNAVRDIVIIRDSTLTASFTEALGDDTVYVDFTRDLDDLPIGKNTNVIITPYGRLNITRPIAIKSLMIEKDTAFGQVSGVDMLQAESVEVMHYFYRHIDEGSYRWFAFSVPFTVSVAEGIFMNEAHDVARYGVDFVIDEYDGHLRATTQEGWKRVAANATLYPGKFYMIASKQANIWYFKALDPSTAFDAEPFAPITAYSSAIGDHHAGWNGIANTLFVNANLQAKNIQYATTYNNYYGVYSVMPLTNYMTERPGMPFFVQASEHDTIEFRAQPEPLYTDGGIGDPIPADAPSRLHRAHESRPFVLSIGNSEYTDKAYVDLAADKEDRYTIGEDLIKMQTSKPTVPQIWINAYDAHLAAYAMPAEREKSAIELGISTPQEGTYTLSFDNVPQGMTMFISKDGEHLYPLSNGEYEIYLEKGVNTNYRIEIYRTPAIYTDIENINSSKGHCEKMIKDGKLYLLYEGTMYNVQGVKVIDK